MGFEHDLLAALAANAAAAHVDPSDANAGPEALRADLEVLRQRITALERLVARLATYKVDGGGGTPTMIGERLLAMVREVADDAG